MRSLEIPYGSDSSERFGRLVGRHWPVFLDSGRPGSSGGRYDILAADPYLTLSTRGPVTTLSGRDGLTRTSEADPFELLKEAMGAEEERHPELPFAGGALGYFAYDLGRRIERLPRRSLADISLPEMAVGLYDWAVVVDHQLRRAWLVARDRDPATAIQWPGLLELLRPVEGPAAGPRGRLRILSRVAGNMDRAGYARAFEAIQRYIREGDCYQVNLAQRFSARAEGNPWEAYRRLRVLNPAPFSAFMALSEGAVLSSSPERFLRVQGDRVETRPIKGTRARSAFPRHDQALAEDLLLSAKDRAENVMIVDLLRNDLGKNCAIGSVAVPELFRIESYATVHHLVSTVTGRLAPGRHALDLLRGCFPGGSITGAPKLRAMEIIEELEPHRRSVYCGAVGYLGFDGAMDTNIAIRTLVFADGWLHAWAGGGIVVDSRMESEYQECLDKAAAMLKLFDGAEVQHVGA